MRAGPPFTITRAVLLQCAQDGAFFTRVPVLFFLKDQAQAVAAQAVRAAAEPKPAAGDCRGCEVPEQLLAGLMETFVRLVVKLKAEAPQLLEPLSAYLADRRGYRPSTIVLYYKPGEGSPPQKVEF